MSLSPSDSVTGLVAFGSVVLTQFGNYLFAKAKKPSDEAAFRTELRNQVNTLDAKLEKAIRTIEGQRKELWLVQDQHHECERRNAELAEELGEARTKIDKMSNDIQQLRTRVANGEKRQP